jgi:hypothetical protein
VPDAGERGEARRGQSGLLDRRVGILLEVAQEPASRDPRMPARILPRDEHRQLERVDEAELREVSRSGQRHEHVAAFSARWKAAYACPAAPDFLLLRGRDGAR